MATHVPQTQPEDLLSYETIPSLSFKDAPIGYTYQGTIIGRPQLVQSRDYETGNPKTWEDGNPVMSVVITLMVDGEKRTLWAQRPSARFVALVEAQKEAGAGPMQEGGTLYIKFIGERPNRRGNPKLKPAKQYAAKYVPPLATPDPFSATPPTPPPQGSAVRPAPAAPVVPGAAKKPVEW